MSRDETLARIVARCKLDVAAYTICGDLLRDTQKRAMASARSTIAAIEGLQAMDTHGGDPWNDKSMNAALDDIIAAWPEELL